MRKALRVYHPAAAQLLWRPCRSAQFHFSTMPHALPDLHQLRDTLLAHPSQRVEMLEAAKAASQSQANSHTYVSSPLPALDAALASARQGLRPAGPLVGLPVSVKDLFDVAGEATQAGSVVLQGAAPAAQDCPAVARLRAAGALMAGRTNMSEFAFSGVGLNPHHGTPANPADAAVPRIPGGSSSGAAVSVATGAAVVGLGSDTGGSIRIPAALCGIVGFKSTARLVPTTGAVPLSTTLDTVCALTRSVRDAVAVHEILSQRPVRPAYVPLSGRKLAVCRTLMQDDLSPEVAQAFERSLHTLSQAGAQIHDIELGDIRDLAAINATGGFSAAESWTWHRPWLARQGQDYDPRVALRIRRGADMSAADYLDLVHARRDWVARMERQLSGLDAVLSPTVPITAPPMADLVHDDSAFFKVNGQLLRNTSVVNMLDGCGLSLPCHAPGSLPVGLMVWHAAMHDDTVLDVSLQIEAALT